MWKGRSHGFFLGGGERMRISRRHQSIGKVYRTLTANLLLMREKDPKKIAEPLWGSR